LASMANAKGHITISYSKVMKAVGISRSHLSRTLQHYHDLNVLQLVQRGWGNRATGSKDSKPNTYRITPQYADKFAEIKQVPACPTGEDMLNLAHPTKWAPTNIIHTPIHSTVPYVDKPMDIVNPDVDPGKQLLKRDVLDLHSVPYDQWQLCAGC